MMDDKEKNQEKPKLKPGEWVHNRRTSHDKLIEGLELLKASIEDAVEETEKQIKRHKQTLTKLAVPKVRR